MGEQVPEAGGGEEDAGSGHGAGDGSTAPPRDRRAVPGPSSAHSSREVTRSALAPAYAHAPSNTSSPISLPQSVRLVGRRRWLAGSQLLPSRIPINASTSLTKRNQRRLSKKKMAGKESFYGADRRQHHCQLPCAACDWRCVRRVQGSAALIRQRRERCNSSQTLPGTKQTAPRSAARRAGRGRDVERPAGDEVRGRHAEGHQRQLGGEHAPAQRVRHQELQQRGAEHPDGAAAHVRDGEHEQREGQWCTAAKTR